MPLPHSLSGAAAKSAASARNLKLRNPCTMLARETPTKAFAPDAFILRLWLSFGCAIKRQLETPTFSRYSGQRLIDLPAAG